MKNRGRSKFFFCFRPVVTDDGSVNSHHKDFSGEPAAGGGGGKESAVIPKILKSISDKNLECVDIDGAGAETPCRKSKSPRRLTRLLKAVLFDMSLSKKFRNRKSRKKSFQSNTDGSSKSDKFISNSVNEKTSSFTETSDTDDTLRINSTRSSSLFSSSTNASSSLSSSCDSSISFNSRSSSQRKGVFQVEPNQTPDKVGGFFCSTITLCLILLCLLVLVFWGRICAILCTLSCFFLCSFNPLNSPVNGVDFPVNVDMEKKVIMDGLLDRGRSRLL